MKSHLQLLMNYLRSVVRSDEEYLHLAMEAYAQGESIERERKAA